MNYVSSDPSQNQFASDLMGLPTNDGSPDGPPIVSIPDPDTSPEPHGFISSLESFGSSAVNAVESGVKTVYGGAKTVVGDVVGGAENVITGTVSSITNDIVIVLVIVVVGLVLIAKSGAVHANIIA